MNRFAEPSRSVQKLLSQPPSSPRLLHGRLLDNIHRVAQKQRNSSQPESKMCQCSLAAVISPNADRFLGDRYRFAVCYGTVALSVSDVGVLWLNGWMDQDATWCGGRGRRRCVRWGPRRGSERIRGHFRHIAAMSHEISLTVVVANAGQLPGFSAAPRMYNQWSDSAV